MNIRVLWLAVALTACSGGETPDTDTPPIPTPTPDQTGDTATLALEPAAFGVGVAAFAVNGSNQAVGFQGFDQAGNPVASQVELTIFLLNERAATSGTLGEDDSCFVTIGVPGPVDLAAWADPATAWWGFTLPAGTPVRAESCSAFEFPAEWGDVTSKVTQHDWGFGVAPMLPNVQSALQTQLGANWTAIEDHVVGAGWYSSLLVGNAQTPGGFADGGYAIASEVDADFVVQVDGTGQPELLDGATLFDAGTGMLAQGAYNGQGVVVLQPASLLIAPPN